MLIMINARPEKEGCVWAGACRDVVAYRPHHHIHSFVIRCKSFISSVDLTNSEKVEAAFDSFSVSAQRRESAVW